MTKNKYRVGTRGSKLALAQAQQVIDLLRSFDPGAEFSFEIIATRADRPGLNGSRDADREGIYTAELEKALLDKRIDLAVHSAKDLPRQLHHGLSIAAFTARIDPRDALIAHRGQRLMDLPRAAVVGVNSSCRRHQLARLRPDLNFVTLAGPLDVRIAKIRTGECQAMVTACAGLIRLGLMARTAEIFPLDVLLPAAGQGSLALQCRHDDLRCFRLFELANHQPTAWAVLAERAVLKALHADHQISAGVSASFPIGFSTQSTRKMFLQAVYYDPAVRKLVHADTWGSPRRWRSLAEKIAEDLKTKG